MSQPISVDCTIFSDGRIRVRRVRLGGSWRMIEQGRQWQDVAGRHVLVMLPGQQVTELLLSAQTLTWEIVPRSTNTTAIT